MRISVVIPCFNAKDYIEDCLNSVFLQSYKNIEVICVDNNSTDKTLDVLARVQDRHPSLILLQERKQGACWARNKGLNIASGNYIQFLDSDDVLEKNKISHQVDLINHLSFDPALVVANYIRFNSEGKTRRVNFIENDKWEAFLRSRLGCTCSNLWHAQSVRALGGWNPEFSSSQEYELMFRMLKNYADRITFDSDYNTLIRDRFSGNISSSDYKKSWTVYCEIRATAIEYIIKNKIHLHKLNIYYQILFDSIRILSRYNFPKAEEIFKKNIPNSFTPYKSEVTGLLYLILYRLFGFKMTEQVRRKCLLNFKD